MGRGKKSKKVKNGVALGDVDATDRDFAVGFGCAARVIEEGWKIKYL